MRCQKSARLSDLENARVIQMYSLGIYTLQLPNVGNFLPVILFLIA